MLLDEGAATIGADSNVCTMLPMGGTVAMGSVCILDDGMATAGGACVLAPASTVCMSAGPRCFTEVFSSLRRSGAGGGGRTEEAAAPCWGCRTGPGAVTEATKAGVRAITEEAGINGLATTGKDDTGADILDKACATAGEHSACAGVPAGVLLTGAGLATGTRLAADDTRPGAPSLGGNGTRVGVPTVRGARFPFGLPGNTAEPTHGSWTGSISAALARKDDATKGYEAAGAVDNLTGEWGESGAREAVLSWAALGRGTAKPVLLVLAGGTC